MFYCSFLRKALKRIERGVRREQTDMTKKTELSLEDLEKLQTSIQKSLMSLESDIMLLETK